MTECINHEGAVNSSGYGSCRYLGVRAGRHVAAYCKANGVHPDELKGKVVMHSCDNRRCINPEHLSVGTQSQNIKDAVKRKRMPQTDGSNRLILTRSDVAFIKAHLIKGHGGNKREIGKRFGINPNYAVQIAGGRHDHIEWPESR